MEEVTEGAKFFPPTHIKTSSNKTEKGDGGGPRPSTAVSYPQICRRWAGANSSCATDAGATAEGGDPGLSVGASAAPTEVGGTHRTAGEAAGGW